MTLRRFFRGRFLRLLVGLPFGIDVARSPRQVARCSRHGHRVGWRLARARRAAWPRSALAAMPLRVPRARCVLRLLVSAPTLPTFRMDKATKDQAAGRDDLAGAISFAPTSLAQVGFADAAKPPCGRSSRDPRRSRAPGALRSGDPPNLGRLAASRWPCERPVGFHAASPSDCVLFPACRDPLVGARFQHTPSRAARASRAAGARAASRLCPRFRAPREWSS